MIEILRKIGNNMNITQHHATTTIFVKFQFVKHLSFNTLFRFWILNINVLKIQ